MPVVSVIVPVYKTKQSYLRDCVDSVLKQTYRNFELILIDDASPDECGALCDEYSKKNPEIIVVHQKCNSGASVARNKGLEIATGEYVIFLDSDDTLALNALEKLVEIGYKNSSDIVLFDYFQENVRYSLYSTGIDIFDHEQKKDIYERLVVPRTSDGVLLCGVCCKFYKNAFLRNHKIQFPESIASAEDQLFFLTCLNLDPSICYFREAFYNYRRVDNSLSFSYSPLFHKEVFDYGKYLNILIERSPFLNNKDRFFATRMCQCLLYVLSKDVFHPQNGCSISKKKKLFAQLFDEPICQTVLKFKDNSFFSQTERIGLYFCRKKIFYPVLLASLKWKH